MDVLELWRSWGDGEMGISEYVDMEGVLGTEMVG